ncbi:MAG: class I SAM-dependent methyltransferase [Alphaproteobacteria bacterium]
MPISRRKEITVPASVAVATHGGPVRDTVDDFTVIDCETCGFAHVTPLPSEADLAAHYAKDYYGQIKPDYLARAKADEPWARLGFDDRLDILEANLPKGRRRLLDIGSGPGLFAAHARSRGWAAEGIEPSGQACAHARSLDVPVTCGTFDDKTATQLGKFDAITLTNMLEHVPDPAAILLRAHECLAEHGLVCVTVPNDYNGFQTTLRTNGAAPWWIAPPHHLNYFGFDSLARLVSRVGFQEIERTTSFPMEIFALMGELYMGNDALGRACHQQRIAFDGAFASAGTGETRRKFYAALAAAGFGREVIIVAQKS